VGGTGAGSPSFTILAGRGSVSDHNIFCSAWLRNQYGMYRVTIDQTYRLSSHVPFTYRIELGEVTVNVVDVRGPAMDLGEPCFISGRLITR
jgi:hypothetical protein